MNNAAVCTRNRVLLRRSTSSNLELEEIPGARADSRNPLRRTAEHIRRRRAAADAQDCSSSASPVLGICYGRQAAAHLLGGKVEPGTAKGREYGRAEVQEERPGTLFAGLDEHETVWMSHGDHVTEVPPGAVATARSASVDLVGFEDVARGLYCIQFHPEVSHTRHGGDILHNFLYKASGAHGDWTMAGYLEEAAAAIRRRVGGDRVLCGISGGVDSAVTAALLKRAIGDQLVSVFVDTGLLRKDERRQVEMSLGTGGIPTS